MKRMFFAIGFLAVTNVGVDAYGRECGEAIYQQGQTRMSVELQPRSEAFTFYFRTGHFAILLLPESVEGLLDNRVKKYEGKWDTQLLTEIRRDIPLTADTDLFKYVLVESRFLQRIEFLVADLLEKGDATVIDAWQITGTGDELTEVSFVRVNGLPAAREFCSPTGDLLLDVTDEID